MNRTTRLVLMATLLVVVGFGAAYAVRQVVLLKKSGFKFVGYRILGRSQGYFQIEISAEITNNSDIEMRVQNQNYQFFIGSTQIGTAGSSNQIVLPPNVPVPIRINATLNPFIALSGLWNEIKDQKGQIMNSRVIIKGRIDGGTKSIATPIPVNTTFELKELFAV